MENHEDGVLAIMKKAEIDTRAPFRSVKEAVSLFGEKLLAAELFPNKLKHMHENEDGQGCSKLGSVREELDETKQSLEKAKEESTEMANCLSSLKEELERTKKELQQLKTAEMESEIEVVKAVEDPTKFQVLKMQSREDQRIEFQKKRFATFANPPSLAQVLERHPSLRKKKKNPFIPLIGGILSKKKPTQKVTSP